jgi:DNA replication and repair protein RecF
MSIRTLNLTHFRSFERAAVSFSDRLTLVVGQNGQGKTNLLEAVYLLLQGRDFRTANEHEVIQHEADFALVLGSGGEANHPLSWRYQIPASGRRSHLGPVMPLVLFSPEDVLLAKGSPDRRRRFLDLLLAAHDPHYARSLRLYNQALLQRNRALKDRASQDLVDSFTVPLIREGVYIWRCRQETTDALLPNAQAVHERLAPSEELVFFLDYGGCNTPIRTEEQYEAALAIRRSDELARQVTLVGPHRDNLRVHLGGFDTTAYASQGQLRTVALSLKLATYRWLYHETGVRPLILLDDVLSELDLVRRQAVLAAVAEPGQQTIITDTEPRSYHALDPAILEVSQGEVHPWTMPLGQP